jgi:hypothetical protein
VNHCWELTPILLGRTSSCEKSSGADLPLSCPQGEAENGDLGNTNLLSCLYLFHYSRSAGSVDSSPDNCSACFVSIVVHLFKYKRKNGNIKGTVQQDLVG